MQCQAGRSPLGRTGSTLAEVCSSRSTRPVTSMPWPLSSERSTCAGRVAAGRADAGDVEPQLGQHDGGAAGGAGGGQRDALDELTVGALGDALDVAHVHVEHVDADGEDPRGGEVGGGRWWSSGLLGGGAAAQRAVGAGQGRLDHGLLLGRVEGARGARRARRRGRPRTATRAAARAPAPRRRCRPPRPSRGWPSARPGGRSGPRSRRRPGRCCRRSSTAPRAPPRPGAAAGSG